MFQLFKEREWLVEGPIVHQTPPALPSLQRLQDLALKLAFGNVLIFSLKDHKKILPQKTPVLNVTLVCEMPPQNDPDFVGVGVARWLVGYALFLEV